MFNRRPSLTPQSPSTRLLSRSGTRSGTRQGTRQGPAGHVGLAGPAFLDLRLETPDTGTSFADDMGGMFPELMTSLRPGTKRGGGGETDEDADSDGSGGGAGAWKRMRMSVSGEGGVGSRRGSAVSRVLEREEQVQKVDMMEVLREKGSCEMKDGGVTTIPSSPSSRSPSCPSSPSSAARAWWGPSQETAIMTKNPPTNASTKNRPTSPEISPLSSFNPHGQVWRLEPPQRPLSDGSTYESAYASLNSRYGGPSEFAAANERERDERNAANRGAAYRDSYGSASNYGSTNSRYGGGQQDQLDRVKSASTAISGMAGMEGPGTTGAPDCTPISMHGMEDMQGMLEVDQQPAGIPLGYEFQANQGQEQPKKQRGMMANFGHWLKKKAKLGKYRKKSRSE
ncbi:Protein of unknown function [Pyronema omphalodes CBS 100304]|uniref:Uncharacterized protein n=1 Tax=Pyronema omphalodes (strain CBS 100304) TaxID=1076935 RepID=U4KZX5_PYROM|nr:Protein of unknown function [Pyronema omphalodes CBS 100304]